MQSQPTCPDCGQEMEIGFITDTLPGGLVQQMIWHRGNPEKNRLKGFGFHKGPAVSGSKKFDPTQMALITSYRCNGCGFLKFYAQFKDE